MSLIYPAGDEQVTPNIGLATWGMDEVLANNMILIDAYTPAGTIIKVNGVTITSPLNLNNNIPAAPGGDINVVWQVSGSNISAYVPVSGIGSVTAVSAAGIAVATPNPIVGAGTITVAGSGSTLVAATAATNLAAAPSGDVLIADGLGNVKDSGVLLSALALLASPSLSGVPTAPTATFGTNTTQLATTAYVLAAISGSSDVLSVFGRTGAVVAQNGDYTYAQISGTPQLAQTFAPIAGEFLTGYTAATGLFTAATPSYPVTSVFGRTGAVVAASGDYTAAMVGALATSLMTTAGDMIYENATPAAARLPIGAAGNVLTVAGGVPVWAAPATSGTVTSVSAGNIGTIVTTSVATATTTPALTFALNTQTANTVFAGPTTGAAAAPSFRALVAADIPSGLPYLSTSLMTTAGDMIYENATPAAARLPIGAAGNVLTVAGGVPVWAAPATSGTVTSFSAGALSPLFTTSVATATTTPALTFALNTQTANTVFAGPTTGVAAAPTFRSLVVADIPALPYLSTSLMTTAGDMIYENATPAAARLPIGAAGNVLTVAGGVPVWAAPATSGTVTSFSAGALSPLFTTSVATATTTPALTFALNTQTANTVFAGPTTGVAAAPTFRALVAADIPALPYGTGTVTSVSAGNIGSIVTTSVATATTTPSITFALATQTANTVFAGPTTGVAAAPTFRSLVVADIPSGLPYLSTSLMTTAGDIIYENSTPTAARLAIGTAGQVLTVVSGLPAWSSAGTGTVTSVSFTGGLISVATPTTTPAFTVAGTSGGVVYFNSATTWASSAVLPAGDVMLGGGAGTAPNASSSLSYISSVLSVSGSAVFPTVPVNGIRITPTGNNSGTVEIYGTNATNSATVWSIDQVGNAGFANVQGNTVTGNSANASATLSIEGLVGSTASIAAMYGNGVTPSSSNFCFAASSASTYLNSVTSDQLQVAGSTILTIASTGTTSTGTLAAPTINATTSYQANGTAGLSAGNFTSVTSITTKFGLVTVLTGAASDERLKTAITPYEGGLDEVLDLSPIRFHWNEEGAKFTGSSLNKEEVGFTAQNVQRVLPEAITYEGNERHLNFRDRPVIALLVNAVKELNAKNVDLEARLERLEELLNVR